MKRLFLAAAVFALAACSSHLSGDASPGGAAAGTGNGTRDTPPPTVPRERPTRSY